MEHTPHVSDAGDSPGLAKSDYAANSGDSRYWSADVTPDEWFSPNSTPLPIWEDGPIRQNARTTIVRRFAKAINIVKRAYPTIAAK